MDGGNIKKSSKDRSSTLKIEDHEEPEVMGNCGLVDGRERSKELLKLLWSGLWS